MEELKVYSRKQVAELLGVCTKTVDKLAISGGLKRIRIGERRVGFTAASVREYQQSHAEPV